MTHRFEARQWIPFPVAQVFAFFANPHNLPLLMPPELKTRIEALRLQPPPSLPGQPGSLAAGVGTEIVISFCPVPWLPLRVTWVARITQFVWESHFCDEQVRGPFQRFRHRHGMQPEDREGQPGTLVSDEIEFVLPFGWIGRLGSVLVRRQLNGSFRERQDRLPRLLANAAPETQLPR